jgi:hypothetical protein
MIKGMDFQGPAVGGDKSAGTLVFRKWADVDYSSSDAFAAIAGFGSAVAGTNPLAHVKQNADVMHEQSVPFLLPKQTGYAGECWAVGPADDEPER